MRATCHTIRLLIVPSQHPPHPSPRTMATFEPWRVGDIPSTAEHPAITAILDTDIETLTAFKDTLEATPVKPIFESIIVILTFVRRYPNAMENTKNLVP